MKFVEEFKEFAVKGNALELAVGVVIGGAFGKIVTSLVNDIIMPLAGLLPGNVDLSDRFINLSRVNYATLEAAQAAGAPTLNYGLFINNVLNFLIISVSIFFIIKQINRFRREA